MENTITLDKVLSVSARDYVDSQCKSLGDYKMVGVHEGYTDLNTQQASFNNIPRGTEVIVDYVDMRLSEESDTRAYGTALIPKKK